MAVFSSSCSRAGGPGHYSPAWPSPLPSAHLRLVRAIFSLKTSSTSSPSLPLSPRPSLSSPVFQPAPSYVSLFRSSPVLHSPSPQCQTLGFEKKMRKKERKKNGRRRRNELFSRSGVQPKEGMPAPSSPAISLWTVVDGSLDSAAPVGRSIAIGRAAAATALQDASIHSTLSLSPLSLPLPLDPPLPFLVATDRPTFILFSFSFTLSIDRPTDPTTAISFWPPDLE